MVARLLSDDARLVARRPIHLPEGVRRSQRWPRVPPRLQQPHQTLKQRLAVVIGRVRAQIFKLGRVRLHVEQAPGLALRRR